jgi:hypothetical protein
MSGDNWPPDNPGAILEDSYGAMVLWCSEAKALHRKINPAKRKQDNARHHKCSFLEI